MCQPPRLNPASPLPVFAGNDSANLTLAVSATVSIVPGDGGFCFAGDLILCLLFTCPTESIPLSVSAGLRIYPGRHERSMIPWRCRIRSRFEEQKRLPRSQKSKCRSVKEQTVKNDLSAGVPHTLRPMSFVFYMTNKITTTTATIQTFTSIT